MKVGFASSKTGLFLRQKRFSLTRSCSTQNQKWRTIFEDHAKRNNVSTKDWYKVDAKNLDEKIASIVKNEFKSSLYRALCAVYPETDWHAWKFDHQLVPSGFWQDRSNQRKYLDEIGKENGIQHLDDWYSVMDVKFLDQHGGRRLLNIYNGSPIAVLTSCYPEHKWIPWKFNNTNLGFWSLQNQRAFFEWLGTELGVKQLDDWYSLLSTKTIIDNGGGFLKIYKYSPSEALKACYPQHNWMPWKFKNISNTAWRSPENRKAFFDWLGNQLEMKQPEDWYSITQKDIIKHGASGLLAHYGGLPEAMKAYIPNYHWMPWKFKVLPHGFWKSPENQRAFFDYLGAQLGVQELDDWYTALNVAQLCHHGGRSLLNVHDGSASKALMAAYPEHNWQISKFSHHTWNSSAVVSSFMAELSEKLCIRTLDDWYRVDNKLLRQLGAAGLINKHDGLYKLLIHCYPDHPWDRRKFNLQKKSQRWLLVLLKQMFPERDILEDYVYENAKYEHSQRPMQLDAFIPSLSLAFEYQGEQHFRDVKTFGKPTKSVMNQDAEKRRMCAQHNIQLVEVPYWWNKSQDSLQEMIHQQLPIMAIAQ